MSNRYARVEDAIAAAHDQPARIKRRVSKANAWSKVVWVNASDDALTDVRHIGQIVLRDYVSCLHKSADRWANGISVTAHSQTRFVERRVKVNVAPTRVIRRHVQFVAQSKIECPSTRNLPIILDKETVVSRAQAAVVDACAEDRLQNRAVQEISEAIEIDLASDVQVLSAVVLVVDDFGARANAVLASGDRDDVGKRS